MLMKSATMTRGLPGLPQLLAASVALACLGAAPALSAPRPVQAEPDDQAGLRLARTFRAAGDAASAIPIYRTLISHKGADPELKVELGDALLDADLVDDAIGVYGAVDPKSKSGGEAELGLARAELRLNQPVKALAHMDRAAALSPGAQRVLIGRGVVLDRIGRHAEAQASYRAALAQSPRSVAGRTDLALSLALTGQYDEAAEILEPIARSASGTPQDRQNLAFVYGLRGDKAGALALGRLDLDEKTAQANAAFYESARRQTH